MIVTFVSQCEKKALNKTRRVLDAFANRIGNRTWQTVITNEGLQAGKMLGHLPRMANMSVSQMLDSGEVLKARISEIVPEKISVYCVSLSINFYRV